MAVTHNSGARCVDIRTFNTSAQSFYILRLEALDGSETYRVEGWRERNQSSPVIFGGQVRFVESDTATLAELLADHRFSLCPSQFGVCPKLDKPLDYTILEVVLNVQDTASLTDFISKQYVSLEFGVSQITPQIRELVHGTVTIRQGV